MAKLLVSPNSTSAQPPASPVDTGLPQTVTMSPMCHAASGTGWSLRPALGPLPRGPLRLQVWAETGAQAGVLSCPQGLAHTHLPPWPEGVAAQTGPVASLWAEAHIKDQDPGLGGPCHPASGRCLGGRLSSTHLQLYLCTVQVKSCGNDEQLAMASPRWGCSAAPAAPSLPPLWYSPRVSDRSTIRKFLGHGVQLQVVFWLPYLSWVVASALGPPTLSYYPLYSCGREASPAVLGDQVVCVAPLVLKCRIISHGTVTSCWEEISGLHAAPS